MLDPFSLKPSSQVKLAVALYITSFPYIVPFFGGLSLEQFTTVPLKREQRSSFLEGAQTKLSRHRSKVK